MSRCSNDNVVKPSAVGTKKYVSPTMDHAICQPAAEVPGDKQLKFSCTGSSKKVSNELQKDKNVSPFVAMGNAPRKLLTTHRKLLVDIKRCCSALSQCRSSKCFELESLNYYSVKLASDELINNLKSLHDEEQLMQLSSDVINRMRRCSDLYQTFKQRFNVDKCDGNSEDEPCPDVIIDVEPTDSISQVASPSIVTSSKSSLIKLVELERKQAEIEHEKELARTRKLRLVAEAEARRDKAEAHARLSAEVEEAEALTQMRLESINLKAEEKLMALSQRGSSVMT